MSIKNNLMALILAIVLSFIVLGACSQVNGQINQEQVTIKVAVLPILDTLPMFVAQQEGFYQDNNLIVEFIPVGSGAERDQLIAAGQADAMVNELVSTILYNKGQIQVQTVRYARVATSDHPLFSILASANSEIQTPLDLKNSDIGISEGTIIEYITDRLIEDQGLDRTEVNYIPVPKIPDRMALLASGELEAAMLPDPLTYLAEQSGAYSILDDSQINELSFSTITFRKSFIDDYPEAVRGFLAAVEEATDLINQDPSNFANLLTEQKLVPAPILDSYQINPYPTAGIPTKAQWDDVVNWLDSKGLLNEEVSYNDSVTEAYLP